MYPLRMYVVVVYIVYSMYVNLVAWCLLFFVVDVHIVLTVYYRKGVRLLSGVAVYPLRG